MEAGAEAATLATIDLFCEHKLTTKDLLVTFVGGDKKMGQPSVKKNTGSSQWEFFHLMTGVCLPTTQANACKP